jgi:hypothetical protein
MDFTIIDFSNLTEEEKEKFLNEYGMDLYYKWLPNEITIEELIGVNEVEITYSGGFELEIEYTGDSNDDEEIDYIVELANSEFFTEFNDFLEDNFDIIKYINGDLGYQNAGYIKTLKDAEQFIEEYVDTTLEGITIFNEEKKSSTTFQKNGDGFYSIYSEGQNWRDQMPTIHGKDIFIEVIYDYRDEINAEY